MIEPNHILALKKYIRAGKRGDSEAYNCAGLLVEKLNPIEAVEFFKKSIENDENNTDAIFNMALLYYSKREEAEYHNDAVMMMRKAAGMGNFKAKEYLE